MHMPFITHQLSQPFITGFWNTSVFYMKNTSGVFCKGADDTNMKWYLSIDSFSIMRLNLHYAAQIVIYVISSEFMHWLIKVGRKAISPF